jgi:CRISPR-associated protein Cas2
MSRNRFLVTYDITADRRRDRVFKALKDVGDHLQYSVFMCDLNEREYIQLRVRLRERINANEDQVLIIDLGPSERETVERVEAMGLALGKPQRVQIV